MEKVQTIQYQKQKLSSEALDGMEELGLVLKTIYLRMKHEGYEIVDNEVVKICVDEKGKKT